MGDYARLKHSSDEDSEQLGPSESSDAKEMTVTWPRLPFGNLADSEYRLSVSDIATFNTLFPLNDPVNPDWELVRIKLYVYADLTPDNADALPAIEVFKLLRDGWTGKETERATLTERIFGSPVASSCLSLLTTLRRIEMASFSGNCCDHSLEAIPKMRLTWLSLEGMQAEREFRGAVLDADWLRNVLPTRLRSLRPSADWPNLSEPDTSDEWFGHDFKDATWTPPYWDRPHRDEVRRQPQADLVWKNWSWNCRKRLKEYVGQLMELLTVDAIANELPPHFEFADGEGPRQFPAAPIRNAGELALYLTKYHQGVRCRILRDNENEVMREAGDDAQCLERIHRGLRNARRALRTWFPYPAKRPEFDDAPSDLHEAETLLEGLIDWLADPSVGRCVIGRTTAAALNGEHSEGRTPKSAAPSTGVKPVDDSSARMTWQRALKIAEEHVARNGWPGLNAMMKLIPCSKGTMTTARDNSQKLREAEAAYNAQRPAGRTRQMTAATSDSLVSDNMELDDEMTDASDIFERLLQQARPSERGKLIAMKPSERRALVTAAQQQKSELQAEAIRKTPRPR